MAEPMIVGDLRIDGVVDGGGRFRPEQTFRGTTPEMWVSGDGISVRSAGVRPWMRARLRTSAISVLCVCSTPFGSAVVPDVYISISS